MKNKHFTAMLLVFIGLAALSFTMTTGVKLRLKPQQDKTYTITSKANMMTMMEVQGQTMNMSQVYETKQSFNVKEATDDRYIIETQIDVIKLSVSQMGMKLEYDSEHPEKNSPLLAEQIKAMEETLTKPVTVNYDALGHLVGDSIDASHGHLKDVIIELPEDELSIGSKWSCKKTQNVSDTEISVDMEYTVTGISKKSIEVSFTGNIESTEVTGSYSGTASINPQTGLVMNCASKQNLSMTHNQQGLSIPITVVGTTTIEVK